jgi:hypothetical protein
MNLEFKCSADKVQAKAQKVLERYYGVLENDQSNYYWLILETKTLKQIFGVPY